MNTTSDSDNGAPARTTEERLAANRANAQKSTGPRTAVGKAIVALNGVVHGIHAVNPVLPGESPHVWRRFKMAMYVNLCEAVGRPNEIERKRLENRRANQLPDTETCDRIQRYEAHLFRQFHRDIHQLERLQARRLGQPMAHAISIDVDVSGGAKSE